MLDNNITAATIDPVFPGTTLRVGSNSSEVARVQTYLNALRTVAYPTLMLLTVDGKYGTGTRNTVVAYQAMRSITPDGMVGRNTWDTLILDYNTRIGGSAATYPGIPLRSGSRSQDVSTMQTYLNDTSAAYTAINAQAVDGAFGSNMSNATRRFQMQFGLTNDAVLGKQTWTKIVSVRDNLEAGTPTPVTTRYPGVPLQQGSVGDNVRFIQSYLNAILNVNMTIDGIFGTGTRNHVIAFQASKGLTADGIVGSATWGALIPAFNATL